MTIHRSLPNVDIAAHMKMRWRRSARLLRRDAREGVDLTSPPSPPPPPPPPPSSSFAVVVCSFRLAGCGHGDALLVRLSVSVDVEMVLSCSTRSSYCKVHFNMYV